jgi:hypothetical protein
MNAPTVVLVHGTWHGAWCWSADTAGRVGVDDHVADTPPAR